MLNIYLLIQNDLETGPYTLEELLHLPLQSKDLIWIIGQSEDWQGPLQVPSLKPYFIEGAAEPRVKEEVLSAIAAKRFIGHISGVPSLSVTDQRFYAGFLDTKILKVSDKQSLLPEGKSPMALPNAAKLALSAPLLSDKQASEEEADKPASEIPKEKAAAIDAGYEEAVEERRNKHEKPILAVLSVVIIFFIFKIYQGKQKEAVVMQPYNIADAVTEMPEPVKDIHTSAIPAAQQIPVTLKEHPLKPAANENSSAIEELSVDSFIDSVQQVVHQQDSKQYALRITAPAKRGLTKNSSQQPYTGIAASSERAAPIAKKAPLHQQVALKSKYLREASNNKLTSVELTVQNNSPELLKTVSVDVYYYKKGERLFDKETVYFNNVHPRQSLTMSIPGNKKATTARFQLGAITAAVQHR